MRGRAGKIAWIMAVALSAALMMAGVAMAGSPQAKSKKTKQPPKQEQPQDQTDQPTDQQKPADQPPGQQPPPGGQLFTGKVMLKSSHQGKSTATAGFNGVGPDGKVKEALLNANPSAEARAKAAQLTLVEADAAEVQAFAKEGKLNPPPAKSGDKKGK